MNYSMNGDIIPFGKNLSCLIPNNRTSPEYERMKKLIYRTRFLVRFSLLVICFILCTCYFELYP